MHGTVEFWWLWDHHNLSLFPLIHLINIVRWSTYPIKPWNKQPPFPYQFCRFRVPKHKIRANHSRGKIDQSNHWAPWPRSPSHRRHKNIQNPTPRESIPREFQGNHNGLLEFDFAGNRISSIWMDSFRFLVHQFLPSSHFEFPKKKVSFFFFSGFFLFYPFSSFVFSWDSSSYLLRIVDKRSVVGLNFDFVVLNLTKHSSYLIYNAVLYFSSAVQRQYREKYGIGQVCVFGFSFLHFLLIKKFLHYVSFLWS